MVIDDSRDKEKSLLSLDEGFPDRVFKTTFLLSLVLIVCSLSFMSFMLSVSLAIGCFISIALFKTSWWTIRHAAQHKKSEMKSFFLKMSILKYFVIGAMLLSACLFLEVNVVALALGLGIVVAVVILKIVSKILVNYMNRSVVMPYKDINKISINTGKKGV